MVEFVTGKMFAAIAIVTSLCYGAILVLLETPQFYSTSYVPFLMSREGKDQAVSVNLSIVRKSNPEDDINPQTPKSHPSPSLRPGDKVTITTNPEFCMNGKVACQCTMIQFVPEVESPDQWQPIAQGLGEVYSAYLDPRYINESAVIIHGAVSTEWKQTPTSLWCLLWPSNNMTSRAMYTEAVVHTLFWHDKKRIDFHGVILKCAFPIDLASDITAVSLATGEPCSHPQNVMLLHHPPPEGAPYTANFTLCLGSPLHKGYGNVHRFVEWMELSTILGAQKIFIYNHSISDEMQAYLEYYSHQEYVQVLPYQFNFIGDPKYGIYFHGQQVLYADCLYRNMLRSKHVAYNDIDETIVPRGKDTYGWSELLEQSGCSNSPAVMARNVFLRNDFPKSRRNYRNELIQKLHLLSLLQQYREEAALRVHRRSKYFARPEYVRSPVTHYPNMLNRTVQKRVCILEPDLGTLYHFRTLGYRDKTAKIIEDTALEKYKDLLITRTLNVHKSINPNFKR